MEKEIITIKGEVQLMKRKWYELYKIGWYKHTDGFGGKRWIRFFWHE